VHAHLPKKTIIIYVGIYICIYICIYLYIYTYIHTYICSAPPPRSPAMFFILYIGVWNGMNGEWQWQWYERNNNQTFLANGTEWRLWISGNFSPEPWLAQVLSKSTGNRLVSFVFSSLPKVYTHFSKIWTPAHIITYYHIFLSVYNKHVCPTGIIENSPTKWMKIPETDMPNSSCPASAFNCFRLTWKRLVLFPMDVDEGFIKTVGQKIFNFQGWACEIGW